MIKSQFKDLKFSDIESYSFVARVNFFTTMNDSLTISFSSYYYYYY